MKEAPSFTPEQLMEPVDMPYCAYPNKLGSLLMASHHEMLHAGQLGLLPFVVILFPVTLLILLEPDLSTAAVVVLLAGLVLFAAGARIGHFLVLGVVMLPLLWHEIVSAQYRLARMVSFLSAGGDVAESLVQRPCPDCEVFSGRGHGWSPEPEGRRTPPAG